MELARYSFSVYPPSICIHVKTPASLKKVEYLIWRKMATVTAIEKTSGGGLYPYQCIQGHAYYYI